MSDLHCPVCGTELGLDHLFVDADNRAAVARLIEAALPIGARLLQYARLFTPPKTRLTQRKQVRVLLQLLPDLERGAITHRGRDWAAPLAAWAQAIDLMLASRDASRLELPLRGHGYLYAILMGMADKTEAAAEAQAEADRRDHAKRATVQVNGQAMSIGGLLGSDTNLLGKLGSDPKNPGAPAAPMPAELRAQLQKLKGK